ncbi:PD-(D/E)XK nuclease family protein [Methanoregula sp.]|uniref:PD-(D/E)XK nuclease family protein n=1 Tax=Methanoregula sp. TaxID=2052170 RepID=UPI0035667F59
MPALHLLRGLPEKGPEDFLDRFVSASAADPFSSWLILPTRRLVRTVKNTCGKKNIPLIPSRICTPDDLCLAYFEEYRRTTRLLSKPESKILLSRIINDRKKDLPLFFFHGKVSPGTLENFRDFLNVITRRKIAYPEVLGDLQSDKSRQIGFVVKAYRDYLGTHDLVDSDTIRTWVIRDLANVSHQHLFRQVFIYGLYKPLPLEQELILAIASVAESCTIVVPEDPNPGSDRAGTRWLEESGIPVTITEGKIAGRPLAGLFSPTSGRIDTTQTIRTALFPTRYAEVAGIAEEICRLHATKGIPFSDMAVTFPEVRESVSLVRELFSDYAIPWTTTTGTHISHTPVVEFLVHIPGIPVGQFAREEVMRFIANPYFVNRKRKSSPGAPLSGSIDMPVPACSIDPDPGTVDLVCRVAQIEKGLDQWKKGFDRLLARIAGQEKDDESPLMPVRQETVDLVQRWILPLLLDLATLDGKKSLSSHRKDYQKFLSLWGLDELPDFPGETLRNEESAAVEKFLRCLDRLDGMAGILGDRPITTATFSQILSTLAKETEIYPDGDRTGVALLGLQECMYQQIPCLFIAGLTEGDMPRLTTRIPFTNTLESSRMGTRSLAEILDENRYYFVAALLAATDTLYLSTPLSDGENPLLSSAFFERVKEKTGAGTWGDEGAAYDCSDRAGAVHAGTLLTRGEVCTALSFLPPDGTVDQIIGRVNTGRYYRQGAADSVFDGVLSGDEMIRAVLSNRFGPLHVYSPTTLETYAVCPFRFFLEKILGLSLLPDVETSLSASDRGTAVHAVLSTFYRRWKEQGHTKVLPAELVDAAVLMTEIATAELAKNPFESPLWNAVKIQMLGGAGAGPGIFAQFLTREAAESSSPLSPSHFELAFGMKPRGADDPASVAEPVELAGREGTETIRIKGRIDRIDETPEGIFSISDYKTGSQLAGVKEVTEGTALQLPLYLLAYEKISGKTGVAAGYYRIRREVENKYVLLDEPARDLIVSSHPRATKDFRDVLLDSHAHAAGYIREIRAGNFPLQTNEKCGNPYCEFKTVCRFDPLRAFFPGRDA